MRGEVRYECGVPGSGPTLDGADRRVRPLRVLPADVSDLRALERGDGYPAGPRLSDEGGPRGARADDDGIRRPLRRVSRVHGVRDRVSLRGPVRPAHRANPRADRTSLQAAARRTPVPLALVCDTAISATSQGGDGAARDARAVAARTRTQRHAQRAAAAA